MRDCSNRTKGFVGRAVQRSPAQLDRRLDRDSPLFLHLCDAAPHRQEHRGAVLGYDFSHANGNYLYTIPAGSPIATPNPLPDVFNKLQQLHLDARHRLTKNLAATFSYLYEPFRVYDFAFDPSVVNGIVQPSSLVMGYVYRPYTANAFNFGVRYFW